MKSGSISTRWVPAFFAIAIVVAGCQNSAGPLNNPLLSHENGTETTYNGSNFQLIYTDPGLEVLNAPSDTSDFGILLDAIRQQFPGLVLKQFDITRYIDSARTSIRLATPSLDRQDIVAALKRAVLRGVDVRVVTEAFYRHSNGGPEFDLNGVRIAQKPFYDDLVSGGVTVIDDGDMLVRQMHSKYMVLDGSTVIMSTGLFTSRGFFYSNSLTVIFPNHSLIAGAFIKDFEEMAAGRFGTQKDPSTSNLLGLHIGRGTLDIFFGPGNGDLRNAILERILGVVDQALVYANHDFTDLAMGSAIRSLGGECGSGSGRMVSGVVDGEVALAEGQASQAEAFRRNGNWLPDHQTGFSQLNAFAGGVCFGLDLNSTPPYRIRFLNVRYFATDPTSWLLDPVVGLMTGGLDQAALLANDGVLLIFHDRDFSRFFFSNIHVRTIAATTILNAESLATEEPPLAQIWGKVSVRRTDLPSPFDDTAHPDPGQVRVTYLSLGVAGTSGNFGVNSAGDISSFVPVGIVPLCINGNGVDDFNECVGQTPKSEDTWRNVFSPPKILLPGASLGLGQITFRPLNPFPPPGGQTTQ
ncbi:MAG: phospholipase D family protein [bacterium JZ-2024 1]